MECGKRVNAIVYKHLKRCCGLTVAEYKEKYPTSPIMSSDTLQKCIRIGENNGRWKGGIKDKFCIDCNKKLSQNNISGYCASCARKGDRNPFYNMHHNEEVLCIMKEKAQKRDKSTRYKFVMNKELIAKINETKRKNWSMLSKDEQIQRLLKWISAGTGIKKDTVPELIMKDILDKIGLIENVDYFRNVQIFKYNVDFLIKNEYIIECFGDYWHQNPTRYAGINAKRKQNKDKEKFEYLVNSGYVPVSFWESDIKRNIDVISKHVVNFLGECYVCAEN